MDFYQRNGLLYRIGTNNPSLAAGQEDAGLLTLYKNSFALWMHRNDRLHNSPKIDELLGLEPLRTAAVRELRRCPENLTAIYHPYFQLTMLDLLIKTPLDLRGWFALIKLARETSDTDLHDQFSMNGPLRKWIGLPQKA